jgi:hypothetical protein
MIAILIVAKLFASKIATFQQFEPRLNIGLAINNLAIALIYIIIRTDHPPGL